MPLPEFAPIPKKGEAVRRTHWGNWIWTCHCGFEATCCEDVGGHRAWHRELVDGDQFIEVDPKPLARLVEPLPEQPAGEAWDFHDA